MSFTELTKYHGAEGYKYANECLIAILAQSNLNYWKAGDPISATEERVLVGTVTWSGYEMKMLETLNEVLNIPEKRERITIDVFNLDHCPTKESVSLYIPSWEVPSGSYEPVIGYWNNGVLARAAAEPRARFALIDYISAL